MDDPAASIVAVDAAAPADRYRVSVRALCAFAARHGDLDLRFTPAPTARQGIEGHGAVTRRRGGDYRREVRLQGRIDALEIVGRADGVDLTAGLVEEIKTHRGDAAAIAPHHLALHWAQAMTYAALLAEQEGRDALRVAVVHYDIVTQRETRTERAATRAELRAHLDALAHRFLAWARQELAHRGARDAALRTLAFPYAAYRPGQRQLAENAFRAARLGRCLMAQAPTGIGKTLGTIFPVLKGCPEQALDKVFYLTAKTSGRALALHALARLREPSTLSEGEGEAPRALPLRVVELVARDKACVHPDKACHGDSCPLAKGFYDRLPAARAAAVEALTDGRRAPLDAVLSGAAASPGTIDPASPAARVAVIAAEHAVCPYYLTQELVRWADVVVADYNHWFDRAAMLHAWTVDEGWRVAVLVDEAHNLVDRAREMYSATLDGARFTRMRKVAPARFARPLERLARAWRTLLREASARAGAEASAPASTPPPAAPERVPIEPSPAFVEALARTLADLGEDLLAHPAEVDPALLEGYFDLQAFASLAQSFGEHSMADVTFAPREGRAARDGGHRIASSAIHLRNVVPASFLAPRHAAAHATVLFSATLAPTNFYLDLLGLPDDTAVLEVDSPFRAPQLDVRIASNVSTRWRDREASLARIVRAMAAQYEAAPGNYLAFFSSYAYLDQAVRAFALAHPTIPAWPQARAMSEAERAAFVARFVAGGRGIGFAVLGGAFSEAIDLPGERLVGAFIATLGLPQVNAVNEAMRARMDAIFGRGYDYTYFYPGLRKVVQAAGRVIRTPDDRGTVLLLDERFLRREARALLPAWWAPVAQRVQ